MSSVIFSNMGSLMAFPSKHLTAYSQYLHYEIWIGRAMGATSPHLSFLYPSSPLFFSFGLIKRCYETEKKKLSTYKKRFEYTGICYGINQADDFLELKRPYATNNKNFKINAGWVLPGKTSSEDRFYPVNFWLETFVAACWNLFKIMKSSSEL